MDTMLYERNKAIVKLVDKALKIAIEAKLEKEEIDLLIYRAKYLSTFGLDKKREDEILDSCQKRCEEINYKKGLARIAIQRIVKAQKQGDYRTLRKLSKKTLELTGNKNNELRANALIVEGNARLAKGELDQALKHFQMARNIGRKLENKLVTAISYVNMAVTRRILGDYEKAFENGLTALKLLQSTKAHTLIAGALDNMAANFVAWNKFPQAMDYFRQSLVVYRKCKNDEQIIFTMTNIASLNLEMNRLKMAERYFMKAIDGLKKYPNPRLHSDIISNLAKLYQTQGKYDRAIDLALESTRIDHKNSNVYETPLNLLTLCYCYLNTGEYDQALKYGKQAETVCKKTKLINKLAETLELLSKCYEATGHYRKALVASRELTALNKKLTDENDQKRMAEMDTKYRAEKNEIILKETKAKNRIVQKSLKEKNLLLREIHHRVKNNLQLISSLINLQARRIDDEKILAILHEGRSRVKAMALIHQKLYQSHDIATLKMQSYFEELVKFLENVMKKARIEIKKSINAHGLALDIDTVIPIGLIVNELVSNVFKYAFEGKESGNISIELTSNKSGKYTLMVSDDGKGLPSDFNQAKSKSLGLRLVHNLAGQLNGTVQVDSESGTKFIIEFAGTELRKRVE
jgi:two-component sensor histidine kinase